MVKPILFEEVENTLIYTKTAILHEICLFNFCKVLLNCETCMK